MLYQLKKFLEQNVDLSRPLILAYSGGIDSQALFLLFLECKKKINIDLRVVHVDHQWRESSGEEAEILKDFTTTQGVWFYLRTIDFKKENKENNLEGFFRSKRYEILSELYHEINAGSLFLAHHKNDLCETVFKRIFEGASLCKLGAMAEVSTMYGMNVFRPLLKFEKKELEEVLKQSNSFHIHDSTNFDPTYLRARQRGVIFPKIERAFGKGALSNLEKLSKEAHELSEYLLKKVTPILETKVQGPFGLAIDLKGFETQRVEIKYLIRHLCKSLNETISNGAICAFVENIEKNLSGKKVVLKEYEILLYRRNIYFLKRLPAQSFELKILEEENSFFLESDHFVCKPFFEATFGKNVKEDLWKGEVPFCLEKVLQQKELKLSLPFLRPFIPYRWNDSNKLSNSWLKIIEVIKEKQGMKLQVIFKNSKKNIFNSLKSQPLLSSES
jgi:tRNA(Ile)-lysidine synthetase-like protein